MGMTSQGRSRVRWIRILVVVLALTASRNNFPLGASAVAPGNETVKALRGKSKSPKKQEGVIPSRRHRETHRADWLKRDTFGTPSSPTAEPLFAVTSASPGLPPTALHPDSGSIPRSDPLTILLRAVHISSLPPPA